MTISSQDRKDGPYSTDGVTVDFPVTFKCFTSSDVRVILTDANSVETVLDLDTDYTVTLNADQNAAPGGVVTTIAVYASGYKITLVGNVDYTQETDITNGGGFYPEVIENSLDKLTMQVQQVKEQVDRAVKVDVSSTESPEGLMAALNASVQAATLAASQAESSADAAGSSAEGAAASAAEAAASPVAAPTHAAASKNTPADADEIPLVDSAAAFALKRLTWANLKAALKTYFDTVYTYVTAAVDPTFSNTVDNAGVTPAWVRGLIGAVTGGLKFGVTTFSSPYTPALGETLSRPHGLSVTPKGARLILECVVADANYSVGSRITVTQQWTGSSVAALQSFVDGSNCSVKCASEFLACIPNKLTGSAVTPTSNSWKYCFEFSY